MKTNGDDYRKSDAATRHKNDRFANVMIRRCDATYNHGHACSTILAQTHIFPVIFVYFIIHLQMHCLAIIRQMIDIYIYIYSQPKWSKNRQSKMMNNARMTMQCGKRVRFIYPYIFISPFDFIRSAFARTRTQSYIHEMMVSADMP